MKTWPKLYKLDSKEKVRVWWIEAIENPPAYYQNHGTLNGKIQRVETHIECGKNIGKANETSPWEQCKLEAESIWTKQRDRKGYTETIPTSKPSRPMLAKNYHEDGKHIKFPCFVQPKLNGLRCWAVVENKAVTLLSRQNTEWTALTHLVEEIKELPDGIYDGELYIHGPQFQKIIGAVKRDEPNNLSAQIEYHIYDIVQENEDFCFRIASLVDKLPDGRKFIRFVETKTVVSPNDLKSVHQNYVDKGYEGIMLRNKLGGYKINGRSKDLQKYKAFDDDEFEIIDATETKVKGTCTFRCTTKDGNEFNVMPEGSKEIRQQYWTDWNAGKISKGDMLTVKYFGYTTTDKPVPYIPIGIAVRNYE